MSAMLSNLEILDSYLVSLAGSPEPTKKKSLSTVSRRRASMGAVPSRESTRSTKSKGKRQKQNRRGSGDSTFSTLSKKSSSRRQIGRSESMSDSSACSVSGRSSSSKKSKRESRREQKERGLHAMIDQMERYENCLVTEQDSLRHELSALALEKEYAEQKSRDLEAKLEEMQAQLEMVNIAPSSSPGRRDDTDLVDALRIENDILRSRLQRHEFSLLKVNSGKSMRNLVQDDTNEEQSNLLQEGKRNSMRLETETSLLRTSLKEKEDALARQTVELDQMKQELHKTKYLLEHTGSIKYDHSKQLSAPPSEDSAFFGILNGL